MMLRPSVNVFEELDTPTVRLMSPTPTKIRFGLTRSRPTTRTNRSRARSLLNSDELVCLILARDD